MDAPPLPSLLHQFRAEESYVDTVVSQRLTVMPPVGIGGVQDFRSGSAGQRDGDKHAVAPVKGRQVWILRKLGKLSFRVRRYGDYAAMLLVCLIEPEPSEEPVACAWLAGEIQVISILLSN